VVDATLERVVPARFPEVGALRREASAFLNDSSTIALREKLLLVVSELCTNAIEALSNPTAEFTLRVRDLHDCVVVEVEDEGPGFSEAFFKPGADDNTERGRGLAVVKSLVDDFSVVRKRSRTIVRCVLVR
jgi:anti-sigma regulatory factor (Ser/Thr protein kinase)